MRSTTPARHQTPADQPGGFPGDFGLPRAGTANASGTLTGEDQERRLADGLDHSPARRRLRHPEPPAGA
ncbi:hypothetical protein ACQP1P_26630 [Dactylosporangium sp. CA-052675]|uniref:hypothetical protein n=1 Tax=Dactylosporangium sp. CA-052675 TaxID=3239927 RepID=UPI003D89FE3A